jgi:hypothetical protein
LSRKITDNYQCFFFSTVELERIISEAQGVVYYGAHTLNELVGPYKCPNLSKNGKNSNFS